MILFVDKVEKHNLGGATTNNKKAEYILAAHGLTFKDIIDGSNISLPFASAIFTTGRFIVIINLNWDCEKVNIGFINHQNDLDKNFDTYADVFTPKSLPIIHKLQEELKLQSSIQLNSVELSSDDVLFEKMYQIYKTR